MNPFQLTPEKMTDSFMDWQRLYPGSYDKWETDPYTRVRVILMNGTEFEAVRYSMPFTGRKATMTCAGSWPCCAGTRSSKNRSPA